MYPIAEFQECDSQEILGFIRKFPFAMVSAIDESNKIVATHIPLLIDDHEGTITLRGHVMRKTEHWHAFHHSNSVLVAFNGPNAPVLASWMEDRAYGGTWNYLAIQIRGNLTFIEEHELVELLRDLKVTFEVDPSAKFDSLPADYVPKFIASIEGFRIEVTSTQAVFKLSQNRSASDFENVARELEKIGGESALVAHEMRMRQNRYFGA